MIDHFTFDKRLGIPIPDVTIDWDQHSKETQQYILELQRSLSIPNEIAAPIFQRLAYLKKLTRIRKGNLPSIKIDVHLESDEICHLEVMQSIIKSMRNRQPI